MKVTDEMVSRFLRWRLPDTFAPDCGISFKPIERHPDWTHDSWPVGTNLFTAVEARAMLEYALSAADQPTTCTCDGGYKLDADCPAHGDPSFANVGQPSPVAYGCTGCQSVPCVCNDVLRNVLAEAADWIATAHQTDCSIFWRNSTDCNCGRDALYHRICASNSAASQPRPLTAVERSALDRAFARSITVLDPGIDATGDQPTAYCRYCGVPDGDGHTADCQHPSLASQPSAAPDPSRCYACGWPLAPSRDEGCVPGDCSYRPSPAAPDYWQWRRRMEEMQRAADNGSAAP